MVSEAESPAPWRNARLERPEESLTIEEVYIAPPLPRRPDYDYRGHRYRTRESRQWPPPPEPSYRPEYEGHGYRAELDDGYRHVPSPEQYWRQHRARSPQTSESSSACSATDCSECEYSDLGERFDNSAQRKRAKLVPYVVVPGSSVRPPRTTQMHPAYPGELIHQAPHTYRLHGSYELDHSLGGSRLTRESPLMDRDNCSLLAESRNQMVLFQGTARSTDSGDGMSMMQSNVSSPRWSAVEQRYISGSEMHSDTRSHSPPASIGGLYECPDPRFSHVHARRLVVITRSDERHELSGSFEGYDSDDEDGGGSVSDGGYSESERSFSSNNESGDYSSYSRDYERRY
jgi:hypothetical protein